MFPSFSTDLARFWQSEEEMLDEFRKSWKAFRSARAGPRFQKLYRERKTRGASRVVVTVVGIVLLVGGVVLLFIPGPGIPLSAFGAALLAQQSLWLAKLLDRLEPVLRRLARKGEAFWRKAAPPLKAALVSGAALVAAAAIYGAYLVFLRK